MCCSPSCLVTLGRSKFNFSTPWARHVGGCEMIKTWSLPGVQAPLLICKRTTFSLHWVRGILTTKTFLPECSLLENQGSAQMCSCVGSSLPPTQEGATIPSWVVPRALYLEFCFSVLCHTLLSLLDSEPTQQEFCNSHIYTYSQFPAECLVKGGHLHICRRHNGSNLNTLS